MITKAEIQSIDYSSNTGEVRIPYFESAGNVTKAIAPCTFACMAGVYNNYKIGDVVIVAFEDGQPHQPVVIGKLYLGASTETNNTGGTINCSDFSVSNTASIPLNTKLTSTQDSNYITSSGTSLTYTSIKDITDALTKLNLGSTSVSTTNQFINKSTIMIMSPVVNINGVAVSGFTAEKVIDGSTSYYYIKYNGSKELLEDQAIAYMKYMTGTAALPDYNANMFSGAFVTIDRKIYCPVWDGVNKHLKLLIKNDESLEAMIKRIIDEYINLLTVTDISLPGEARTLSGAGTETTDTNTGEIINATLIDIEDLT